jgi:hypothetical protein
MSEVLFIIAMLGLIVAPWIWAYRKDETMKLWMVMWSSVAGLVVAIEIWSKIESGRTISQHFWRFGVDNLGAAWVLSGCMIGGILVLVWHLMAGVYKRRRKR